MTPAERTTWLQNHLSTWLLHPPAPVGAATLDAFVAEARQRLDGLGLTAPLDRALVAGAGAPGVGFAFALGYAEALRTLVPSLPRGAMAALCVTEEGGGHPRAIRASVQRGPDGSERLVGEKRWATAAGAASRLLVAVSRGQDEAGRNRIAVALIESDRVGVRLEAMPPTPFCPEVPHHRVTLAGVPVSQADWLPGDGYERYLRPFRSIEDAHVTAAVGAYVLATAGRLGLDRGARADLVATLLGLRTLPLDQSDGSEIVLDGLRRQASGAFDALEPGWLAADAESGARWRRDRPLLQIAGAARTARTEAAWRSLDHPGKKNHEGA